MISIDYKRIATAVELYTKLGYQYVETPWLVDQKSIDVTKPKECRYFETQFGHLVASGEQSFLQIRDELCPSRKYQTVTPCFRDDQLDEYHFRYFLKLELIIPLWKKDDPEKSLNGMIEDVKKVMWHYGAFTVVSVGPMTWDFHIRGIEVGSYGVREHEGFRWVYGTGIAEPRMSQALEKHARMSREEEDAEMAEISGN